MDEIAIGTTDAAGAKVVEVYARNPPLYAVYRTDQRVMVQFADKPALATDQRSKLIALNPVRSEINGLIDGWRGSADPTKKGKARRFDHRVADALVLALEGDPASAVTALEGVKSDILNERTSWARFLYLIAASAAAALLISIFLAVATPWITKFIPGWPGESTNLWLAGGAGAVGAFFSIAITVSKRTILTDLQMRDNVADAILRVIIGVISGAVFECLLQSKAVSLNLGSVNVGDETWTLVALAGFIAGFSQQLVPDLLASSTAKPLTSPPPASNPPTNPVTPSIENVVAPKGPTPAPALGPVPTPAQGSAPIPTAEPDADEDGCLGGDDLPTDDVTPDADLPAATGGVAAG